MILDIIRPLWFFQTQRREILDQRLWWTPYVGPEWVANAPVDGNIYISVIRWKNTIKSTSSRNIYFPKCCVWKTRGREISKIIFMTNHIYKHLYFYTRFWWGNLGERDHLGDPGVDGRIILRWRFRKWNVGVCTGSSWCRIGTGGGNLWMR